MIEAQRLWSTIKDQAAIDVDPTFAQDISYQGPFISEIDFYKLIANRGTGHQNASINELIIQAGLKPGRWKE